MSSSKDAGSGQPVYAAGTFTAIGGQPRNRIAAIDKGTGLPSAWDPNANNSVLTIALNGSTVFVGGNFTSIGGQNRNRIAALDIATGAANSWDPNVIGSVEALGAKDSRIYIGGNLTAVGAPSSTARTGATALSSSLATDLWLP